MHEEGVRDLAQRRVGAGLEADGGEGAGREDVAGAAEALLDGGNDGLRLPRRDRA